MKLDITIAKIRTFAIVVIITIWAFHLLGCCFNCCEPVTYYGPSGKPFPMAWGKPPDIQTKDHRPLPYGYGYGSSTLYGWIMKNKE